MIRCPVSTGGVCRWWMCVCVLVGADDGDRRRERVPCVLLVHLSRRLADVLKQLYDPFEHAGRRRQRQRGVQRQAHLREFGGGPLRPPGQQAGQDLRRVRADRHPPGAAQPERELRRQPGLARERAELI
jgi:hypothetical protein